MKSMSSERRAAAILLAPFVVITAVFVLYPLVISAPLALHQTSGATASRFVGIDNFRVVLGDPDFWKACRNTAIFTAGSIGIQLPIALLLATILNSPTVR
ncbi:MAG: sugar ABC transporter permease, partial [Planctomycetota bacterium]